MSAGVFWAVLTADLGMNPVNFLCDGFCHSQDLTEETIIDWLDFVVLLYAP